MTDEPRRTQLDHFAAILDATPADWVARLALADLLAEQAGGECPASRCQRWMARRKTSPASSPFSLVIEDSLWLWEVYNRQGDSCLPPEVYSRLGFGTAETITGGAYERRHYATREEAERDLAGALDHLRREYGCD